VQLLVPAHAEVANAVGAVLGQVSQRVHLTVTQPVRGTFRVFTKAGPKDFADLTAAVEHAQEQAAEEASLNAIEAGAEQVSVNFSRRSNSVNNDIDGNMFFEAVITATATGAPRKSSRAD
jgi:hypothetical protein